MGDVFLVIWKVAFAIWVVSYVLQGKEIRKARDSGRKASKKYILVEIAAIVTMAIAGIEKFVI